MRNIPSYEDFLYESKPPVVDKFGVGNLDLGQLGQVIRSASELKDGRSYCLVDGGDWYPRFTYGRDGKAHRFEDELSQMDPGADDLSRTYTDEELRKMVAAGHVAVCNEAQADRIKGTDPTHKVGPAERGLSADVVAAAKALVAKPKDRKLAVAYLDAMTACLGMGWNPDDRADSYIYYTVPGKPRVFAKTDCGVIDAAMEVCFDVFPDVHAEGMDSWRRAGLMAD